MTEVDDRLRAADALAGYGLDGRLDTGTTAYGIQTLMRRARVWLRAVL